MSDERPADAAVTSYGDEALRDALVAADLVDAWVGSAGVSAEASLLEVAGSSDYDAARTALISRLGSIAVTVERVEERADRHQVTIENLEILEESLLAIRRSLVRAGEREVRSTSTHPHVELHAALMAIDASDARYAFSLDPLDMAEYRVAVVRDQALALSGTLVASGPGKDVNRYVQQANEQLNALSLVDVLLDMHQQLIAAGTADLVREKATIAATMPDLHRMRLSAPSAVGGLPVVTVDAYVRGASHADAACPVDWALLAGIGRVESFHGTLGDSHVQTSGKLSNPIFGPLLDGGATEREAKEAEEAAAELAAAEAARAAAEAAQAEAEARFNPALWGEAGAQRLEERAAAEEAENEPPPRFDPRIWGEDANPVEDDEPAEEPTEDDETAEDEEPGFKGNGFAVIEDSDGGRLDGNSRWDRAVGPMQFIPETWSYWETDGNGDGQMDPQNLYDASAAAARFLCHLSRTKGASPYAFVLGYNSSDVYVNDVMAFATTYGASALPTISG